ncbi:hypothetical protein RBH88_03200 [Aminobacterium sp. MB27-C1]|uniref:hypothetical protein n=1 Tax=Aminobacterium sp. MB27-C1 TaxID=3070661 RepID=UPI0027DDC360|nr:hypothetical protein [Aminobacterium sp. MB27-C1]WMI72120.1 hypothetical protein RBH88_03200 [Aminobacterium sp. MB27-C1]
MVDIFNSREIAIGLWLLAFSVYIYLSPKVAEVRKSFRHLLSVFFVKQILLVLGLMVAYMVTMVYFLSELDLWNVEQIKNTIFWFVSVGFMSLFKIETIKKDRSFFKHSVIDNLKLLAIFQFIVGFYTFTLWIEVLLALVLALIGAMLAITESDKKYHQVKSLLEYFLSSVGIILIVYSLYMLATNFGEFGNERTVYDFFVPPLLTLCYLPFIFAMLVYSTYEQVFIRLQFSIKNKTYRNLAKLYAIIFFNIRMSLLDRWSFHIARENIESHADLIDSFRHIHKVRKAERNPKDVPIDLGWSPYHAKEFISSKGLSTGFYNRVFEDEWFASSPMEAFGDVIIPDNVAYYVEGSEELANTLKLIVSVNDATRSQQARRKLLELAEVLSLSSLNKPLSEDMEDAIVEGKPYSENTEGKIISLAVEEWPNHRFNGYDLKFVISSI